MSDIVDSAAPFCTWDFHVVLDADWHDPLPQLLDENEEPFDLTDKSIEIFVRPAFGYDDEYFDFLTTLGGSNGITYDDRSIGLATIHIAKANLQANYPIGKWQWFMRIEDSGDYDEVARGDFYVHAGSDHTGT